MYELQLVNNGFLAEYNEDNKVFVESILLDSETLKRLNSDDNDYADFIDVEFSPACKKVDRVDLLHLDLWLFYWINYLFEKT